MNRPSVIFLLPTLLLIGLSFSASAEKYNGSMKRDGASPDPSITANCSPATAATELNINNTRALIQTGGDMWWDFIASRYEIPKGTGRTSLFAGSLWLGGQDVSGQLKVAALRFRGVGNDYWTGPLSTVDAEISAETCREYDRHWLTFRDDVSNFVGWFEAGIFDAENGTTTQADNFPGYSVPAFMYEWPAHGRDVEPFNEDYFLAPYTDRNGDGFYSPDDGDYPAYDLAGEADCREKIVNIYGDQNLWWVFNDKGNVHTETGAQAIGMEIRAQAFAFATNDEVNNMTFYNYELVNRSTFTLTETYFGVWVDADLGNSQDDFVGCDVVRGLGYCYNGDNRDEDRAGQLGYGEQPPAVGVDFFQGPFQDPDGLDNLVGIGENEALNGVGYGDGEIDNERFGMRRFLYHNNTGSGAPIQITDPETGTDYYNYLRGIWKDGSRMVYEVDGDGYDPANPSAIPCDFMFPGETDPLGWGTDGNPQPTWTEETADNTPFDRRFAQSAGPFTLEPGAVNNITVGVVWARASSGGPYASVQELRRADDKTQALFDNCFQILNGPDAPDIAVQELDKEVLLYLSNTTVSNNYRENYAEENPFLIPPDSVDSDNDGLNDIELTDEEKALYRTYVFQGYQIYQLASASVGADELDDADQARLVTQVDLKDGIDQLVNFEFNDRINGNEPKEKSFIIEGGNEGIRRSFRITEDLFATGNSALVNHKTYHFMVIAYGYNNFGGDVGNLQYIEEEYDPNIPEKLDGQKEPYLASRKGATGPIRVISVIPHKTEVEADGTVLNSSYGDEVELTRIEGQGNGGNFLQIKDEDVDAMFALDQAPWKIENPTYVAGRGPVSVKVIDPLNVAAGDYTLEVFEPNGAKTFNLNNASWVVYGGPNNDSVFSEQSIRVESEQLLPSLGLSVTMGQVLNEPGDSVDLLNQNGFIAAEISYQNEQDPWLTFLADVDGFTTQNWIRSGTSTTPEDDPATIFNEIDYDDYTGTDDAEDFEQVLGGGWAPFNLVSTISHGPSPSPTVPIHRNLLGQMADLQSVDIVFTPDQSKWTRCPVIEMHDLESSQAQGGQEKGFIRIARSVDKDGNVADPLDTIVSTNPSHPNYIAATGMSWFPGYAINIETGERLNIAFGEDSWLASENGSDMIWNPTSQITEGIFNDVRYGGKHYIYIFRHDDAEDSQFPSPDVRMPIYDEGRFISARLRDNTQTFTDATIRSVWKACMWVNIPLLNFNSTLLSNEATVRLRVRKPYKGYAPATPLTTSDALTAGQSYYVTNGPVRNDTTDWNQNEYFVASTSSFTSNNAGATVVPVENNGNPLYKFNTDGLAPQDGVIPVAEDALDLINIVPNPYYAYSQYETDRLDNRVKIINLPQTCDISIYTVNGSLVRTFKKDDPTITSQDWDLKNHANVPIASGIYIIHVDAPGIGEKVLKWFGVLRPVDLDSF